MHIQRHVQLDSYEEELGLDWSSIDRYWFNRTAIGIKIEINVEETNMLSGCLKNMNCLMVNDLVEAVCDQDIHMIRCVLFTYNEL